MMDGLICSVCGDRGCSECEPETRPKKDDAYLVDLCYVTLRQIVLIMSAVREGEMKDQAVRGLVAFGLAQETLDEIEEVWEELK